MFLRKNKNKSLDNKDKNNSSQHNTWAVLQKESLVLITPRQLYSGRHYGPTKDTQTNQLSTIRQKYEPS